MAPAGAETRYTVTDLGALGGGQGSEAFGINDRGQVVGASYGEPNGAAGRAVLWEGNGPVVDLNTRLPAGTGWRLLSARAINGRGQIVGQGRMGGRLRTFLLTPLT